MLVPRPPGCTCPLSSVSLFNTLLCCFFLFLYERMIFVKKWTRIQKLQTQRTTTTIQTQVLKQKKQAHQCAKKLQVT